ncbi:RNA polymerase sigma-70 factor, ECF subfamily [Nocardioides lianchengensis]|uniref:RNA polymerase sigma-70 factor, ECF subfamily n=1 Tax=Nocardioides lianchengensis TaxID=1045774 RepID=A0A1G6SA74_9ACTN|nr:RNA polymerase sigma-70 factor, ECF subfamily [Nocardioides lianchengensis]
MNVTARGSVPVGVFGNVGVVSTTRDAGRDPEETPSDEALVRAARLGDEVAFATIVDRHGPGMHRYALRLVGGRDADAAEVAQDALVSAWRSLPSFGGDSALRTWLFRIVHRRAADLTRRRRPVPIDDQLLSHLVPEAAENALRSILDEELVEALQRCLDELPWHQRAVWLLREVEGMSYDEIASTLSLSVGSVRGHLHRGRRTISERMARWR